MNAKSRVIGPSSRWPTFLFFGLLVLVLFGCAGKSEDPAVRHVQTWTDTCFYYGKVLKAVNDSLELQIIDRGDDIVFVFKHAYDVLQPICANDVPPDPGVDPLQYRSILEAIDRKLIEAIKRSKEAA